MLEYSKKNHKRDCYIYSLGNNTSKQFSLFGFDLLNDVFVHLLIFFLLKFLYSEELLFNEYGVLVWEEEKVLEMEGGDICLTM